MIDRLSVEDGRILVNIARQAIEANLEGKAFEPNSNGIPELKLLRGVFVTLLTTSKTQALRGCIGNPFPKSSLLDETVRCAIEAATLDPRFEPVERDELSRMTLEVTVLSPVEYLIVKNPLDLPLKIKVGRDGLLVEGEGLRGLLLPQVGIDERFDEEELLNECCLKAGLMADAWVTGRARVARFQGQIFSEETPGGPVFERTLRGKDLAC